MPWEKSSPALVERFKTAIPAHPEITPKKMFGYEACFVKGNFFAGLHEQNVVLRLPNGIRERIPELSSAKGFDPMSNGKGMKDWFVVPRTVTQSSAKLGTLLADAFAHVVELPAKQTKTKKKAPRSKA